MPLIRLSEVISALSYALDLTEGQPMGHSVRACAIGMRIAEVVGLDEDQRSDLFYALLLKDAGCSANAAQLCSFLGGDDRLAKFGHKLHDHRSPVASAAYVLRHTRPGAPPVARLRHFREAVRTADEGARTMIETRCERGADIARMIELSEATAQAIRALDEHWDGGGQPYGLRGDEIPLLARMLLLAQTAEVYFADAGVDAAMRVAGRRRGRWFDPDLVDALLSTRHDDAFWSALGAADPAPLIADREPEDRLLIADEDRLDRVAEAFATIVDAKSPYTGRHSAGVAEIASGVGHMLRLTPAAMRNLRRAALLHDVGKLGVSNLVLDKPGRLDEAEWREMRRHPELTVRILERVEALRPIAAAAGAHHERLDGSGYHLGLAAEQLGPLPRILAVADVYEALTADRPYRAPMEPAEALDVMRRDVGSAFDGEYFAALEAWTQDALPFVFTLASQAEDPDAPILGAETSAADLAARPAS